MPTRTHSSDPFAPRGTLTREQLLAYAQDRLPTDERQRVELHLEHDPLLREAVEGLALPGADAALQALTAQRPRTQARNTPWLLAGGVVVVVGTAVGWWATREHPPHAPLQQEQHPVVISEDADRWTIPLAAAEIDSASERPADQRIGHEVPALHAAATAHAVEREQSIGLATPRTTTLDTARQRVRPRADHHTRTSRQLLFLHDLKVVHPKELYASDPMMLLADAHVAARYYDDRAQDSLRTTDISQAYTAFLDDALGRFARNDHKGCLDDLRFLLDQYPDDVNALFYGGLCAYNLGMYARARSFLHRAATHPVDVFKEEALWYHALTLERLGEMESAQESFARIASGEGFYAEQAKARLRK